MLNFTADSKSEGNFDHLHVVLVQLFKRDSELERKSLGRWSTEHNNRWSEKKEDRTYYWLSFGCSSLFLSTLFLLYLHVLFLNERNERVTAALQLLANQKKHTQGNSFIISAQELYITSHRLSFQASHKHLSQTRTPIWPEKHHWI